MSHPYEIISPPGQRAIEDRPKCCRRWIYHGAGVYGRLGGWSNYFMWGDPSWRPPPTWKSRTVALVLTFPCGGRSPRGVPPHEIVSPPGPWTVHAPAPHDRPVAGNNWDGRRWPLGRVVLLFYVGETPARGPPRPMAEPSPSTCWTVPGPGGLTISCGGTPSGDLPPHGKVSTRANFHFSMWGEVATRGHPT